MYLHPSASNIPWHALTAGLTALEQHLKMAIFGPYSSKNKRT